MACVNVSGSASISVMELIMTTVLPELSAAPAVNDDPVAPGGVRKHLPITHLGPTEYILAAAFSTDADLRK